jgi:hypothetical protein
VLVAAALFREIRAWDHATGRTTRIDDWPPCHVFEDGSCGGLALFGLAVSPSGDRVFGVVDDDGVVVWDAASGQRIAWWKLPAKDRAWQAPSPPTAASSGRRGVRDPGLFASPAGRSRPRGGRPAISFL